MFWNRYRIRIALAMWAVLLVLIAPTAAYLYSLEPPASEYPACYPEFNPAYYDEQAYDAEYEQYDLRFRDLLASNENPDAQAMSIRVQTNGRSGEDEVDALLALAQRFPDSGFAVAELITACGRLATYAGCDGEVIGDVALDHGDNSAIQGSMAMLLAQQEDVFAATVALRRAIAASDYDDYFSLQLALLDSASPPSEPMGKLNAIFRMFRYANTTIGTATGQSLSRFCGQQAAVNPQAAEICIEYGERVVADSQHQLGKLLGLAFQEVTYQALGNAVELARVRAETQEQRRIQDLNNGSFVGLMTYDESLAQFWFDSLRENGEVATMQLLQEEVQRRSADPANQPCDPPGLRFEFPYFYLGEERVIW